MTQLNIDVVRDPAKFIAIEVGINLDRVSKDGASAVANVAADTIYFLDAYAVSNTANAPFSVQLTPEAGYSLRFVEDPKNTNGIVNWKTSKANEGNFRWRRFFLRKSKSPGGGGS